MEVVRTETGYTVLRCPHCKDFTKYHVTNSVVQCWNCDRAYKVKEDKIIEELEVDDAYYRKGDS